MARREVCRNDYEQTFQVRPGGQVRTPDRLRRAIRRPAPTCEGCGCQASWHGLRADGRVCCRASCATAAGVTGVRDHA